MNNLKVFYLFLILCFAASCNKVAESGSDNIMDGPVPIRLGISARIQQSKAAVEEWKGNTINVFGLKREEGGIYDFEDPLNIVDYETVVSNGISELLDVTSDQENDAPYYYQEGYVYDFFGYHLGGADVRNTEYEDDGLYLDVQISGCNDLMYACTDRKKDISVSDEGNVPEYIVYSASAARRGVHPTLIFNHALTRFNFIANGVGDKYDTIEILALEVKSVNRGRLYISEGEYSFVAEDIAPVVLTLRDVDDNILEVQDVTANTDNTPLGGDDACIMVPPGMDNLPVTLKFRLKESRQTFEHKFTVKASEIKNQSRPSDKFQAGHSYDIYIRIYGPEKIQISSTLQPWLNGGESDIDPDDFEGGDDDSGTDEPGNDSGTDEPEDPSGDNEGLGQEDGVGEFN